jgi:ADP-heptose:LPS heptosyltransferase
VFLAPTGQLTQSVKRWPFFTDLATALLDKGYRVFVAGLKKDFNNVTFDPRVTLLVDRPLGEIGDVIRSCAFTVANDCGLMHYSNALGIHTYVISGPIPPIKSVPPGVFSISKISCPHQPCYAKFPDWNVAPDSGICHHQCMWDVSVDYVLSKLPLLG